MNRNARAPCQSRDDTRFIPTPIEQIEGKLDVANQRLAERRDHFCRRLHRDAERGNAPFGDMLGQARDVRTTTEYAYRRGEASFVEFLDAVRAFNDTMQSYNQARADYARSLYTLDAISGKVTP